MDFIGTAHWSETNSGTPKVPTWARTEHYGLAAGAVYAPIKNCSTSKRLADVDDVESQSVALPSYSEVRQSTTKVKRRKEVLNVESEGCTYSGAFFKDTLTGFGSIVYPQGDRFSPRHDPII
jgi:hypothetical protein